MLASLPLEEYQRVAPALRNVPMLLKQVVHRQDEPIGDVYFPMGGAFSLVKRLGNGDAAEIATIGSEGAIGAMVFFGQRIAECDAMVQLVGPGAHVMGAARFIREMARRGAFFNRIIRYNQALMSQIMQTIACNGLHPAEQRCCRWLLMTHDRAGADEFAFTHEFLATMLGVRRPTVTLIAATLQRRGLVEYGRGWVRIVDRPGLEAASCECYQTVKAQMQRMLPELGAA